MQSNMSVEAFNSINHKLSELSTMETQHSSIYRVHKHLRDVNNNAYEPEIIAIGPYHHGKDNLRMMEEHKLRYLQLLLEFRKENVERYISTIGELEQKARDCYAEPIGLSGAKFVEMLVLDGCFIIELIRKYYKVDPTCAYDPIFQMEWIKSSLQRDLILFENQIPFFVLYKLFDLIEGPNKHHKLIRRLLNFCPNLYPPRSKKIPHHKSSEDVKHLLDLAYSNWISGIDASCLSIVPSKRESQFIHSTTELKDANVEFHKKEGNSLFEVKFENGIMEMPRLTIQDRTECFLRNLIAYEQYFRTFYQLSLITDYVIFLDCLINSSRDVEILCECGIIRNLLGDNEMVANMINRLCLSVIGPGEHFFYAEMFDKVNTHYKKGWNRSMSMLRRDIFYSPWAYISFFAALAILLLTVAQTVCSILQVV